jgi:PAS domain S-box-containing protein
MPNIDAEIPNSGSPHTPDGVLRAVLRRLGWSALIVGGILAALALDRLPAAALQPWFVRVAAVLFAAGLVMLVCAPFVAELRRIFARTRPLLWLSLAGTGLLAAPVAAGIQPWGETYRLSALRGGLLLSMLIALLAVLFTVRRYTSEILARNRLRLLLSIGSALFVAVSAVVMWVALLRTLEASQQEQALQRYRSVSHSISLATQIHVQAMKRLAQRMAFIDDRQTFDTQFALQARSYMYDFPGIVSLVWTDSKTSIVSVLPPSAAELYELDKDWDIPWRQLLQDAEATGAAQFSAVRPGIVGTPEFLVVLPAAIELQTRGYLLIVFNAHLMIENALQTIDPTMPLRITNHDGLVLFERGDNSLPPDLVRFKEGDPEGFRIELRQPRSDVRELLPDVLLASGLALAALLGIAVNFIFISRQRTLLADSMREDVLLQMAEREYAQELLQETADELRSVLHSISDAVYMLDHDWHFTFVNPQAEVLLHQSSAELAGRVIWQAFPELLGTELERCYREAMDSQRAHDFNLYLEPQKAWMNLRVYPHAGGLVVYFKDITQKQESEAALRVSESRFRMVAKATADAIWDWDLQSDAMWWSEGLHLLFGHPLDTLEHDSRSWINRIHPDDRDSVVNGIHSVIYSSHEYWEDEYRFERYDGTFAYVTDRGFVIRGDHGQAIRMVGGMSDVTERRLNQEKLRDSEEHLRAILDTALEGIITVDAGGTIVTVNKSAEQTFGYSARELINGSIANLMSEPDREWHNRYLAKHGITGLAKLQGSSREATGIRRDGSTFPMDMSVIEVLRAGRRQFTGFIRDITERRNAEMALQSSLTELDQRNRELQDFAFVASHDLQEPLRKIRMFSDRLLQDYGPQLDQRAREYLQRNSLAGARMQRLIDDLLAYSRVATRGGELSQVDLNRLVATIVDDLAAQLEASSGEVRFDHLPILVADATQMRQLFQNLISNALKFRHPDRAPRVELHAQPCQGLRNGAGWEITVSDNGIGFDAQHNERIFSPFQRLHGRSEYEGSGIGLAIVKRIVERHGGSIRAQSTPGNGAQFIVQLPERATLSKSAAALSI